MVLGLRAVFRWTALFLLTGLLSVHAQGNEDAQRHGSILGVVMESSVSIPIEGATVTLYEQASGTQVVVRPVAISSSTTDFKGSFTFTNVPRGVYRLQVSKDGYTEGALAAATVSTEAKEDASRVKLFLIRDAFVTGRLVDSESQQPVAKQRVFLYRVQYVAGTRTRLPAGASMTDESGRFVIKNPGAGSYVVGTPLFAFGPAHIMDEDRDDGTASEFGYREMFWPGGGDLQSALPVELTPGIDLNLGELRAVGTALYGAEVALEVECQQDEQLRMAIARANTRMYEVGADVPCRRNFSLKLLQPGEYHVKVYTKDRPVEQRLYGSLSFGVTAEDVSVSGVMLRGTDIAVLVESTEGARPMEFGDVGVAVSAVLGTYAVTPVSVGPDDKVMFRNVPFGEYELDIRGVQGGRFVKEIRYNNRKIAGLRLALDAQANKHVVVIEIDDKAGVISGKVVHRGDKVSSPFLAIAEWPLEPKSTLFPVRWYPGGEDGSFEILGLRPGLYRVVAVPETKKHLLERPHVFRRLLGSASEVRVAPNGYQNINVELSDI